MRGQKRDYRVESGIHSDSHQLIAPDHSRLMLDAEPDVDIFRDYSPNTLRDTVTLFSNIEVRDLPPLSSRTAMMYGPVRPAIGVVPRTWIPRLVLSYPVNNLGPRLPWEVFIMIFEELSNTPYLRWMRLVSRQFEDLIRPIVYRHVILTPALVKGCVSPVLKPYPWGDSEPLVQISQLPWITILYAQMTLFTKHVTIDRELDFDWVCIMLKDMSVLESVRWCYWDPQDSLANPFCTAKHHAIPWKMTQGHVLKPLLHVEQLDVMSPHTTWLTMEPPPSLTTFKAINWKRGDHQDIKTVLLRRRELENLHLIGEYHRNPSAFATFDDRSIDPQERMSPLKELVLENYYWGHSPHTAVNFWNWTHVTHLELKHISMIRFLRTVPPKHLVQLKRLILDEDQEEQIGEVTNLMCDLVHKIHALDQLGLRCRVRKLVTSILKHGPTLGSLELYDCPGTGSPFWTTLTVADVEAISAMCPRLMELGLDVHFRGDISPPKVDHLTDSLSDMRNLRRLKLYTRFKTFEVPSANVRDSSTHLDALVRGWLDLFLVTKKGAKFETIYIDLRVDESFSNAFAHVTWFYEDGKGLSNPSIGEEQS